MPVVHHSTGLMLFVCSAALGAGFLLGSQARPQTEMSQLASAQLMSQDKDVRWIGFRCGDDSATVISREMPNIMECRSVRRLSEEDLLVDQPLS